MTTLSLKITKAGKTKEKILESEFEEKLRKFMPTLKNKLIGERKSSAEFGISSIILTGKNLQKKLPLIFPKTLKIKVL